MSSTTTPSPSSASDAATIESYRTIVDDYVKNGLNLSTGAKIGIGVAAGVVGIVIIGMGIFILVRLRRTRSSRSSETDGQGKGHSETSLTEEQKAAEARRMHALDNM